MLRIARGASLLSIVVLAAACGGNDDDTGETTAAPAATEGAETTAAAAATEPATDLRWLMVADVAGLGDQGFNDLAFAGVEQAAAELGGEAVVLESAEQAQYVPNLQEGVDSDAALTVAVGFVMTDAVVQVAGANPDTEFVLIDSVAEGADGPLANVQSVTFREQEAAYLAGIVAGLTTQTNRLGFLGGVEIPPVVRFLRGFELGVASVNPDATVDVAYVGGFDDSAKGRELAIGFFDDDADIIFEVAGLSSFGAYEEVTARGAGHWIVGVDTCKQHLAPDNYLTSATKDVTEAIFRAATQVVDGTFAGGVASLGLAENGVGVCTDNFDTLAPEIQTAVEDARAGIVSGEIVVAAE